MPEESKLPLYRTVTAYSVVMWLLATVSSAGAVVTPVYLFGKPIVVNAAERQFRVMLAQTGLDPEAFKSVPKDVEQMKADQLTVQSDLATIKQQNKQQLEQNKQLIELLEKAIIHN